MTALLLALTLLAGTAPGELATPDLSGMAPAVRQAIGQLQAKVAALAARDGTTDAELGVAYYTLAEVYHAHGLTESAAAVYEESLRLNPDNERAAYFLGCLRQKSGELEEAAALFERVLARQPGDAALLIHLGDVRLELGQPEAAQGYYERALAADASLAAAHYGLGRAAAARGDAAAAVRHFEKALELQPQASIVHYPLALAYRRLGDLDKARYHLERRGQEEVTFPDPGRDRLSRIAATSALQVVLSLAADRESFSARDFLGFTLGQLGKTVGSVEYLRQAIAEKEAEAHPPPGRNTELARIRYAIAGLLLLKNEDDEAMTELRAARELDPGFAAVHVMLANALARSGDFAAAEKSYDRAIELDPENAEAWLRRATVRYRLGREEEAEADLRRVTALAPGNGEGWLRLAALLEGRGEVDDAIAAYEKAVGAHLEDREQAAAHRGLAALLRRRGDVAAASEHEAAARGVAAGSAAVSLLLVTLDTTRADHLEPYGARDAETPALAALARDGVVFEHAYATAPVTLPAHVSLLTGLDPPAHGVHDNGRHYLADGVTTLAETLRGQGFRTAAFLSAAVLDRRYGLAQGFEVYDVDLTRGRPKEPRMVAERPAEVTVGAALDWLDGLAPGERFFLWVHLFDPHIPYEPPAPYSERFRERPYDGEIAYADAELGRLLRHPLLARKRTLVMVVGDHGESLGEHGEATHAMLAYDSTLRIPWIVHLPEGVEGRRIDPPVSQLDLLPTAVDLLGLELPPGLSLAGVSLAPAILEGRPPPARALYSESLVAYYTYGWARLRAVREGGWKLIAAPTPELYDLGHDPGERNNLFAAEGERAAELGRRLAALAGEEREGPTLAPDPRAAAQLRSLGYLGSRTPGARRERPDPKDVIDLHRSIEKAEYLIARRDFEPAVGELRQVLRRDPQNLAAIASLADVYGETGRWEEAAEALGRALELAPEDPGLHLAKAVLEASRGRLEPALDAVDVALALEPRSLDAKIEKARYLAQLGRREEAVALLEAAVADGDGEPRFDVHYAELVELPAGELRAAEERLRRAVRREPYLAAGWRVLGQTLEAAGRPEEAGDAYRTGLGYQGGDPTLHEQLGLLLVREGALDEAEPHLREALRLAPWPTAATHDGLASILVRRGEWPAAEAEARQAVELEPALASGWNNLALAVEEQGRTDEARAAYERALESDPELWQPRYNLGILERKTRRYADAAAAFEKVLAQVPDHAGAHYELGLLCAGPLANLRCARRHLEASLRADPGHPRVAQIRQLLDRLPRDP